MFLCSHNVVLLGQKTLRAGKNSKDQCVKARKKPMDGEIPNSQTNIVVDNALDTPKWSKRKWKQIAVVYKITKITNFMIVILFDEGVTEFRDSGILG